MMKTRYLLPCLLTAASACAPVSDDSPFPFSQMPERAALGGSHEWTYDGPDGPRNWHTLDPENEACGHVDTQSPVDLPTDLVSRELPDVLPDYVDSSVTVANTGHTIQYAYDPGSKVVVGDHAYELVQFHFHVHSEHAVDGAYHEMELHLVHRDVEGHYLVLGVFVDPGAENRTLADAGWDRLPLETGVTLTGATSRIDASTLIPGGSTYRYQGSLTTPPCTEGVSWIVYERPITMSRAQIQRCLKAYDRDFRPLQPLGTRALTRGE